jgi:hypothetical protein
VTPTPGTGTAVDVSVIIPVYNTMPYLNVCLESLIAQSIGLDRIEIVAVDDGSTDGSGDTLDHYARRLPDTVTVLHQANSGGPAGPLNRGLTLAKGRYVLFIGGDDYLGVEALARMVAMADERNADIVLGRIVGANGRHINQAVFDFGEVDIDLFTSPLPWSLGNMKLFRRDLIERHQIRYPEDLSICSDQPFTLIACFSARRISVLADYECYYLVQRHDRSNITYQAHPEQVLRSTEVIMALTARWTPPGADRDAVNLRHFSWEMCDLLEADFLELGRATQQRLCAGISELAARYLTQDILDRLPAPKALRLCLARREAVDDLIGVIRVDVESGGPRLVVEGDHAYAAYRPFRDQRLGIPDTVFEITDQCSLWAARRFAVTSMRWDRRGASLSITLANRHLDSTTARTMLLETRAAGVPGVVSLAPDADGETATALTRFAVGQLLAYGTSVGLNHAVRLKVTALGGGWEAPLRMPALRPPGRRVVRHGLRLYRLKVTANRHGHLVVSVAPVTVGRIAGSLRHLLQRCVKGSHPQAQTISK